MSVATPDHLLLHFAGNRASHEDLLVIDRGEGPYVFDTAGNQYVDALSSLFCSQLGYSFGEEFGAAMTQQLAQLPFNTNWGTAHPASLELAEALADRAPEGIDHVFFTNGGSESVESMWKMACEHFRQIGEPQRTKAIARHTAYHGVTLGALSFTGVPGFKDGFGDPAIDVSHVSNTNAYRQPDGDDEAAFCTRLLDEVRDTIAREGGDRIAVLIAEPVQNAGGCITPPAGYWQGLREICDEHGILLVADAVICAFGRLGNWLGIEQEGVVPDMITTAKGITAAYAPGGAVFVGHRVAESLFAPGVTLRHGITFGGHPITAAAGLKNIEIVERDGVYDNVTALAPHLEQRLQGLYELPIVGDVRGAGFFWAVEMVANAEDTRFDKAQRDRLIRGYMPRALREAGLIARADDRGDSVVTIAPPLIADTDLLDVIVDRLHGVLEGAGQHMDL